MVELRVLAYQCLLQIARRSLPPDRVLHVFFRRHRGLEHRDKALLTELVYGTLRWQARLDWHLDQLAGKKAAKMDPDVRVLLRMGLYQIIFLDRVPSHAAVNETVRIAKMGQPHYVVGFVNGVLRSAVRRGDQWPWPSLQENPVEYLAVRTSHPRWFVEHWLKRLGYRETEALCRANNTVAPLTLRVNSLKVPPDRVIDWFRDCGVEVETSPRCPWVLHLKSPRLDVTKTLPYERGWIQVQDEASQLVARVVGVEPGMRVLDLCAGFGGKATHMAILGRGRAEIVAVDREAWKLEALEANAARQGVSGITTVAADLRRLDPDELGLFDRVLVDAPCTGFGVLRRNPDIKWRYSIKGPYRLSRVQREIVRHAARFVKSGGIMVYATCTLFHVENEQVADHVEVAVPGLLRQPLSPWLGEAYGNTLSGAVLRTWPHRHRMDGFFAVRWLRV